MPNRIWIVILAACFGFPAAAADADALAIDQNLQARHLPYGTILDPIFESATSDTIASYTRCGDSAIWTGHYLAAQAYRYRATNSPQALDNARRALAGLTTLVDVTGNNVLARCAVPVNSPYASAIASEEQANGLAFGIAGEQGWMWVGNTSRDQYIGVFFGLGAAWDLIPDQTIRTQVHNLTVRLLDRLLDTAWLVVTPDGSVSTTFIGRPDQQLSMLALGRRVDSGRYGSDYFWNRLFLAGSVIAPIGIDALDPGSSYFKYNLDYAVFYNLARLETSSFYRSMYMKAYDLLRRTTENHGNAHFNMVDRAIRGANAARDAETRSLLRQWLERPRRDFPIDLHGTVAVCDHDLACSPIPVPQRVRTDFLWQRSPFQLSSGGDGFVEGAGIDYLLPYWMGRYFGVVTE